jgi:hypothetical protein
MVALDIQRALERRRHVQRDFCAAGEVLCDPAAGVAAVGGAVGPVEPRLYRQPFQARYTTF